MVSTIFTPTPTEIKLHQKSRLMEISFANGMRFSFSYEFLRVFSPSAEVRGHGPGQVPEPTWAQCKDVRMGGAEAVGGYAIRFKLSDHHESGIYSWDFLRAHDPEQRAPEGA